ncbi:MAG: hypothetical protein R3B82_28860 [Sandaracinaceae bacterium]
MRGRLFGALLALTSIGCAADVNEVQLGFPNDRVIGLTCTDSRTRAPLVANANVVDGAIRVSVVIDYLGFEGVPGCRVNQLLAWCTEPGCPLQRRDCVPLVLEPPLPDTTEGILLTAVERLRELGPVTDDAPDGVVLVRMVVTNQACDALPDSGRLRCDDLLGCVYSCPVQLDAVRGTVELELDALGGECTESDVQVCAGVGVSPRGCE